MIKNSYLSLLVVLVVTSGCMTASKEFCLINQYEKGSDKYWQCVDHFNENHRYYKYCNKRQGLIIESSRLDQCLIDAKNMYQTFNEDKKMCRLKSEGKFPFSAESEDQLKGWERDPEIASGYRDQGLVYTADRNVIDSRKRYFKNCMKEQGWKSNKLWYLGRNK